MDASEQIKFIEANYSTELNEVYKSIEYSEYRNVEWIVDKVNNPIFTRYCLTLLADELISFETEADFDDDQE